jgi:hypothetical protein
VEVPGTHQWTGTGVYLQKGERVTISASGKVNYDISGSRPPVGPDGAPQADLAKYNFLQAANHAALIGEIIGTTPRQPFLVGSYYHDSITKSGLLLLGVNDRRVDDNRGTFIAHIEVFKP